MRLKKISMRELKDAALSERTQRAAENIRETINNPLRYYRGALIKPPKQESDDHGK